MSVLINYKICDNAKECGGIAVCPTGALSWDEEKETIAIDNEKCISCGACEKECPIGAIRVAKTPEEHEKIAKEIEDDPRSTKDLFVDRYGAAPLSEFFMISSDELEEKVNNKEVVLVECYNDDSIQCLIKSIPIKDITSTFPSSTLFYKMECNEKMESTLNISTLPSMLVYKDGVLKGKIEGYFEQDQKATFIDDIKNLLI